MMKETRNKKEYVNKNILVYENGELNSQMRTILNDDGSISVNLEDVAIGLGWTTVAKSGNEVVRWNTVYKYLTSYGVATFCNDGSYKSQCPTYIPESLFYLLSMKANNERAQKFQKWIAMDVVPAIRKTGTYNMAKEKVLQQFMEQQVKTNQVQTEFNKMVMEHLERMEKPARNRGSYKGNPFLTDDEDDIEARKEELYTMTGKIAGMWGFKHTEILHQMYRMLEIRLGIVLDCYKEVYRSETGKEDACMAEVIASHDWIYEKAVELCEYAVEKKQNMD